MIRRFGSPPRPGLRHVHRPGVYVVAIRGGAVLATLQAGGDGVPELPGGGVDPGEQPLSALHREVAEETGWSIARPRRLGTWRRFVWMPEYGIHAEKLCTVYAARPVRRIGPPTEPDHAALWLSLDVAVRLLGAPGDRYFLRRAMG
ncbi:MAG: NUDIX domain-containing protein [Paracoccaceae bacterium]